LDALAGVLMRISYRILDWSVVDDVLILARPRVPM